MLGVLARAIEWPLISVMALIYVGHILRNRKRAEEKATPTADLDEEKLIERRLAETLVRTADRNSEKRLNQM